MAADWKRRSAALDRALGPVYTVIAVSTGITTGDHHQIHGVGLSALIDTSLIRLLTIMVAVLAGLGSGTQRHQAARRG